MERLARYGKTTFASLAVRNYRLYFTGQAISLSGTWMQTIAQGLLVLQLSHSGTILGIITALQFLPILSFGPLAGVVVDRFPKQKILFITQSSAGLLALLLGILTATHVVQVWMVGVLAAGLGFVNLFDNPTRQTFIPEMVGKEHMTNAVTLNSWEINLTRIIGPSLAGIVAAIFGLAICFLLNGISYIAVIVVLAMMDTKKLQPARIAPKAKNQLKEGFAYVAASPILRNTLIMLALVGTFTYEFQVILPLVAQTTFHNLDTGYAALTAAMGIGAVVGGLFTANRKSTSAQMLIITSFAFAIAMCIVALAPTFLIAVIGMVLVGAASINFTSIGNVTLQMESEPEMRGRVMSLWTVAFLGSTPIGGPIIGWIGEHLSPRWGMGIGGVAALIAAGIGILTLQQLKKQSIPESVEELDQETQAAEFIKRPS